MKIQQAEGIREVSSVAFRCLKDTLSSNGSPPTLDTEAALQSVITAMGHLLSGLPQEPVYQLASLDPGTGKTEAICAFLKAWKSLGFKPEGGALIVLSTRKEIESCIHRSGLQPCDFAVLVKKDHPLNGRGSNNPATSPVLFTTQEKLRRECEGRSFADTSSFHYRGHPRSLRIWDEAFLPAAPVTLRKDDLLHPLADLRPADPAAAASLESLADSLSAERIGEVVQVPSWTLGVHRGLSGHLGAAVGERLAALRSLAGHEAVLVNCNGRGLHLAGTAQAIPDDFAPALILDASGRVRETYRTMETAGILKRLPDAVRDYKGLRVHHWNRAASRSALSDPKVRQEVLEAAAATINDTNEKWLIVYAQDRSSASYSVVKDLEGLVTNPDRLSFIHWGNHHGTNKHREVSKVLVLGLWQYPQPAYSALHLAAGGPAGKALDADTLAAVRAGEHRHQLLQAVCRASVRNGESCEVYLVGRLGKDGRELLRETFPGAQVDDWVPRGKELAGSAQRVAEELQRLLSVPGARRVQKGDLRASLGFKSSEALAKVIRRGDFRAWADREGIGVTTRAFERIAA